MGVIKFYGKMMICKSKKKTLSLIVYFIITAFSLVSSEAYFHHFFHEVFTENVEKCLAHFEHLKNVGCHVEENAEISAEACQYDRFLFSIESSSFSFLLTSLKTYTTNESRFLENLAFVYYLWPDSNSGRDPPFDMA